MIDTPRLEKVVLAKGNARVIIDFKAQIVTRKEGDDSTVTEFRALGYHNTPARIVSFFLSIGYVFALRNRAREQWRITRRDLAWLKTEREDTNRTAA